MENEQSVGILSNGQKSYTLYSGITIIGRESGIGQFIQITNNDKIESRHTALKVEVNGDERTVQVMDLFTKYGTKICKENMQDMQDIPTGVWVTLNKESWLNFGADSLKFSFIQTDDDSEGIPEVIPGSPEFPLRRRCRSLIPSQRLFIDTQEVANAVSLNVSKYEEHDEEEEIIPETQQLPSQGDSDFVLIEYDSNIEPIQSQLCPAMDEFKENIGPHESHENMIIEKSVDESMNLHLEGTPTRNKETVPDIFKDTEEISDDDLENRDNTVTPNIDELDQLDGKSTVVDITSLASTESKTTIGSQKSEDSINEKIQGDTGIPDMDLHLQQSDNPHPDIYCAATQIVNCMKEDHEVLSTSNVIDARNDTDDEILFAPTQKLQVSVNLVSKPETQASKKSAGPHSRDDNIYDALTQVLPREYLQIALTPPPTEVDVHPPSQPDTEDSDTDFGVASTMLMSSESPGHEKVDKSANNVNATSLEESTIENISNDPKPSPEDSVFFHSMSQLTTPNIFHIKLPQPIQVKDEKRSTPRKINYDRDDHSIASPQASSTTMKKKPQFDVSAYENESSSQIDLDNMDTPEFLNLPSKEELEKQIKRLQNKHPIDIIYPFENPMDMTETETFESEILDQSPRKRSAKVDPKEVNEKPKRRFPKPKPPTFAQPSEDSVANVSTEVIPRAHQQKRPLRCDSPPTMSRDRSSRKRIKPTKLTTDYVTESQFVNYDLDHDKPKSSKTESNQNVNLRQVRVVVEPITTATIAVPQSTPAETKNKQKRKLSQVETVPVKVSPKKLRKEKTILSSDDANSSIESIKRSPVIRTRSHDDRKQKIVFTMVNAAEYEATINKTGHLIVDSINEATVLITDKVYRSAKFLSAIAKGIPILSVSWLRAHSNKLDSNLKNYLIDDNFSERKYQFNLKHSLEDVEKNGAVLNGFNITCSPSTKPYPTEVKQIIESSGGKFFEKISDLVPFKQNEKCLVVASPEDTKFIKEIKKNLGNTKIINSEAFMLTILKNKLVLDKKYLL